MRRACLILSFVFAGIFCVSCASVSTHSVPSLQVDITNVFPNSEIQAGSGAYTLNAKIINGRNNKGVTWSLTAANVACSPDCGTLVAQGSLSAVYTPPAEAPLNHQAVITATSVEDSSQLYSFIFTIVPTTSISITNKFTSVIAGGAPIIVNASVQNDPTNSGATFTLTAGGSSCSPACGTLVTSAPPTVQALYTPPATVPTGASANPTITATAVNRPAATDSFTFTINTVSSLLKGNYVFQLRGYDSNSGSPMAMTGTIIADGNGSISGGEIDFDNGGGINHVPSPATGTYAIDNSFNGVTHGSFEITSFSFPGTSIDLQFHFTISSDGKRGRIIEMDGSGYLNSGTIQLQDTSAVSAAPSGNFAFSLDSDAPLAGRIVSAGQLIFGSSGITGGVIDQSKAADASPTYVAAPISTGSVAAPDSVGRGTLTITVNGNSSDYAYYVVDSDHLRLVQIDPGTKYGTVQAGTAVRQKSLTADSVNGTGILQLTGMDEPSGTSTVGPAVLVGAMNISSGNSFYLTFDSNDVGTILTSHPANGALASFDPATGRAVISAPGGFGSGFVDSAVMYFYDAGSAFFIDMDPSTPDGTPPDQAMTNNALSGTLTPQTGAPFSASSISGNVIAGFGGSSAITVPNFDLALNFDNATGNYTAAGDLTSLPSQNGAATDVTFNGTYRFLNYSLGHGVMAVPAGVFGDFTSGTTVNASFYMIAPNQFVLIGVNPGTFSGVAFFEPQ